MSKFEPHAYAPYAYLLIFLTGTAGLVQEVVWQQYLARLLGSDALASATTLGVFLGGLSLGYFACGRLASRVANPLAAYGLLEGAIGLWALAFPLLFRATEALAATWSFAPPYGLVAQGVLCAIVLIGLPTVCMGGTVPLLTQALVVSPGGATRTNARVYAANTAGACLGTLAAGFVLIERLGLPGSLRAAALLNLVAAIFFGVVGIRARRRRTGTATQGEAVAARQERSRAEPHGLRPWAIHFVAFLGGVYFMTLESLLIRITNLSIGATSYGFALIVAVCVLAVALGAWAVARRLSIRPTALQTNQIAVGLALMVLFVTLDKGPYAAHLLLLSISNFTLYHVVVFGGLLLLLVVPIGLMGATLPLCFDLLQRDVADVGRRAGTLFAWNALGNLVGGLVGGFLVFELLGQGEVFLLVLVLVAFSAVLATIALPASTITATRRFAAGSLFVLTLCFAWLFPFHDPLRFAVGTFRVQTPLPFSWDGPTAFYRGYYEGRSVQAYRDAPEGTFAVVENLTPAAALAQAFPQLDRAIVGGRLVGLDEGPRPRSIFVNGKSDSSTYYDRETLKLSAHLPALLAGKRDRVLIVGLGTGVTAGEFTLYPDIRSIDVAEISPTVVDFLPYFEDATHRVQDDARLAIHVGDAFRILRRSSSRWNVITSEPSNPWMTGTSQLFSRDFYRLVRARLEDDGLFLQWFQRYGTSPRIAGIVVRTLRSEFPHVRLFRLHGTDDLFLASPMPLTEEDLVRAGLTFEREAAVRESLAEIGISSLVQLLALEDRAALARLTATPDDGVETLDRPRIHYLSGRAFFRGESVEAQEGED